MKKKQSKDTSQLLQQLKQRVALPLDEPDSAAYDDAWRTEANDASHLLIPLVNEAFGEHYSRNAIVTFAPNEHLLNRQDGETALRITDTSFSIEEAPADEETPAGESPVEEAPAGESLAEEAAAGESPAEKSLIKEDPGSGRQDIGTPDYLEHGRQSKKHFLMECESSPSNGKILVRIFEYIAQIGLDQESGLEDGRLTVRIPRAAVIFLRSNRNTRNSMEIAIEMDGRTLVSKVPAIKISDYSLEDIFEKELYILLPFFLFNYERRFEELEHNKEQLEELKRVYRDIGARLDALAMECAEAGDAHAGRNGLVDEFTKRTLMDMANKVAGKLAAHYPNVRKGVRSIMGGKILNYEAKRIRDEAMIEALEGALERENAATKAATASTLASVAERMILLHTDGGTISEVTGFDHDEIEAMARKLEVNLVWTKPVQ